MGTAERPWILGLSASHNGAACLLHGSEIVVAVQEERLSGIKRDRIYGARPSLASEYCLAHAGIAACDLDLIVVSVQGEGDSVEQDVTLNPQLRPAFHPVPWLRISHHLGHAISAYALSGFTDAAVLVVDGMGSPARDLSEDERAAVIGARDGWEIISVYEAAALTVRPVEKQLVPDAKWLSRSAGGMPAFASIGGMYSAVAQQIFGDPMDAGKVMGLAPLGTARFEPREFVTVSNGLTTFDDAVPKAFEHDDRWPRRRTEYADLAASVQGALEDAVLALARRIRSRSRSENLCYSGGVALNCVVNQRLQHESGFRELFIAPFAEDSGPAVGAAFYGLWQISGSRTPARLTTEGLGHRYGQREIDDAIRCVPGIDVAAQRDTLDAAAARLCQGQIGGWFEGGSELGPRALGRRSILADPRRPAAKHRLNSAIKRRETFRPFAPSVMAEHVTTWFDEDESDADTPFMLRTLAFRPGMAAHVPAVAHVDNSARPQSVRKQDQPQFYDLIRRFYARTDIPMLLNTSLNGSGQPIVETPRDALWAMLELALDFIVVEGVLVQPAPDFTSILDFVPVMLADGFTVDSPLRSGGMSLTAGRSSIFTFDVPTPWGIRRHEVTNRSLGVVALVDGRANGRQIYRRLCSDDTTVDPGEFIRILAGLHRTGVIDLRAAENTEKTPLDAAAGTTP